MRILFQIKELDRLPRRILQNLIILITGGIIRHPPILGIPFPTDPINHPVIRILPLSSQKRQETDTIYLVRDRDRRQIAQSREYIRKHHEIIQNRGLYLIFPINTTRYPDSSFIHILLRASERTVIRTRVRLPSVIGGEDNNRVLQLAVFL